tara:strand:- start:2898 stop:4598 length:1701 start_codon:yes stop_codon:yes gene_type:complete
MNSDPINKLSLDKEINLKSIYILLINQKKLIAFFSSFGFVLACLIALFTERVWKGEFQIVLNNDKNVTSISQFPQDSGAFSSLIESSILNYGGPNIKTEVEILKSPSVLVDIFEFVKARKNQRNNQRNNDNDFRFNEWRKSLDIKVKKGTSILDISYVDNDKDLIKQVLDKVSIKFQSYTGEKRLKKINLGIKYFEDQISIYNEKSITSFRKAQQFAIDQDLAVLQDPNQVRINNKFDNEFIRLESANQIRFLDKRINNLKNSKVIDSNLIIAEALSIPELSINKPENVLSKIIVLENQLSLSSKIYKVEDIAIKKLLKDRDILLKTLKDQLIGVYNSRKKEAQSKLNSLKRPKSVLIKYSKLIGEAYKDRKILESLDTQYRALLLEKARNLEPWNLITKPTLLPNPVGTSRKFMAALGLFYGLILGCLLALVIELKRNKIISSDDIEFSGEYKLLDKLSLKNINYWEKGIELISKSIISNTKGDLGILIVDKTNDLVEINLEKNFKKFLSGRKILLTSEIRELLNFDNLVLIATLNVSTKNTLKDINKKLKIQNKKIFGSIIICD